MGKVIFLPSANQPPAAQSPKLTHRIWGNHASIQGLTSGMPWLTLRDREKEILFGIRGRI
jgi:hypothetical protein